MSRDVRSVFVRCLTVAVLTAAVPVSAQRPDAPAIACRSAVACNEPAVVAPAFRERVSLEGAPAAPDRRPAQDAAPRQGFRRAVEAVAGYAGFLDDALIGHTVVAGAFRYRLGRRVSVGPEVVSMAGPGRDRDVFITGNVTVDFLVPADGPRAGTISPYVVAAAGFMVHRPRFGSEGFSNTEGAVTGGGGVRVWMTERVYAVGEYRAGWEPHARVDGGLGFAW